MARFETTPEMDTFLRKHYKLVAGELAREFNEAFGTDRTAKQIHGMRNARKLRTGRTGQFYTGQPHNPRSGAKCANKSSFKKGSIPKNSLPVGSEVVTKDGYIKVKIAGPRTWVLKHRYVWEQQNGPIPDDHIIWFKDQCRTNCDIENLMIVPRALQVRYNKNKVTSLPEEYQETAMLVERVEAKRRELSGKSDKPTN